MALRVKIIATDSLSGTLLRVSKNVARLGIRFVKMGVLAAGVISAIAIKLQKDMDRGLREIGTLIGGLTDVEIKNMTKELQNLASTSGQAMDKLLKAKYDIISAGFTNAADSAILLSESTKLAVGGVTEVSNAADLLTTALNAYSLSANKASEVSDKLFTIVRLGKTTMDLLGASMGRLLAITGQFDISLDEVGAALAVLTAAGQKTEEAVTAIRASVIELLKPQTELRNLIAETSFKTTDALLASEGYAGALRFIKEEAKKANIPMKDLFGNVRSMQAVLPLTGLGAKSFAKNIDEMATSFDAANEAYAEMQKSFDIVTKRLRRNIENIIRSFGVELIKKLQPRIEAINKQFENIGDFDWSGVLTNILDNWSKILLAMGQLTLTGGKIIGMQLMKGLDDAFKSGAFIKTIEFITDVLDRLALAFWILTQNAMMFRKTMDAIQFDQWTESVEGYEESLQNLKDDFKDIATALISEFMPAIITVDKALQGWTKNLGDIGLESLEHDIRRFVENDIINELADALSLIEFKPEFDTSVIVSDLEKARNVFLDNAQQITNAVGDVYNNFLNLRKAQIQSELDAQIKAVLASGLAEEEKQAKISNLREAARRKEIAAAKAMKPIQIAQAISYTALGVIKAWSDPGGVAGAILSVLIGIAGAAEVATIAAQPYAHGGFGFVRGNIPTGDTIPAMLNPTEIVSTPAASERFGAEIQRFNQLAEGGFGGGQGITYNIYAIDSQSFVDMVRRNPNGLAEAIQITKEERFL